MEYGCPSLHKYVVTQLKYSPAEAWTRISAMRLIRDSAPALKSLAKGKLTLSNAFLLQENKKNIKEENFDQILKMAEEKSFRELETILQEIKAPSQSSRPKKIELSVAILEKMKRLKKYYGQELSEIEMIEALLDKELKQQESEVKKITSTDYTKPTRYLPKSTRAFVLKKANFQCQGISRDGARCLERRNLQFEHIHPFGKGGHRDVTNLELLCPSHNARRKYQSFGSTKVLGQSQLKSKHCWAQ